MSDPATTQQVTFTLSEVLGILGGVLSLCIGIIGFFIRRGVFKEIDDLKEGKQDKPYCGQQLALCSKEFEGICGSVEEMKGDLKEGRKEFKFLHQKLDRILGAMKLRFDDLNKE